MGKRWDGGDIAFRSETWKSLASLLYPGAFLIAFSGSRGWHRQAVAMEDAGLIIHPMMGWLYGQGFPKATRIDTQIDRKYGTLENDSFQDIRRWIREKVKESGLKYKDIDKALGNENSHKASHYLDNSQPQIPTLADWNIIKGLLKLDEEIQHQPRFLKFETDIRRKVGEQTKARKSDQGIPLPSGGETEYATWDVTEPTTDTAISWSGYRYGLQALKPALEPIIIAQVPYDGKPIDCITTTGAGALNIDGTRIGDDAGWSYPKGAGGLYTHEYQKNSDIARDWNSFSTKEDNKPIRSNGGRWPANFVLDTDVAQLLNEQSGLLKSGKEPEGGFVRHKPDDDFSGLYGGGKGLWREEQTAGGLYGDSGGASRFFFNVDWNAEAEECLEDTFPVLYQAKASRSERDAGLDGKKCSHPTVKPISLCKWLATLLLPPDKYSPRRILIPFSGVSSEMIGAHQAGWECIIGIEGESEYVELGEARMKYWTSKDVQPELI